ncbi:hypothetical protein AB0J83_36060 [Actinoplanes sp. NPDC049596]|uniref:hypothetical protein n=1 Tax=unclassified Actinoplanes TaxID=2626549 RepID=UPI003446AD45
MKALVLLLLLAGCTAPAPPRACGSPVRTDALPEWARAGFSGDGSGTPHVFGERGEILAVLFGAPLRSPPAEDRSNKILWVPRAPIEPGSDLTIVATLAGADVRAEEKVAPGPSLVDLPRAGCWHLTLAWSGRTDTMDLIYE